MYSFKSLCVCIQEEGLNDRTAMFIGFFYFDLIDKCFATGTELIDEVIFCPDDIADYLSGEE